VKREGEVLSKKKNSKVSDTRFVREYLIDTPNLMQILKTVG
jgi:hypothetical protein